MTTTPSSFALLQQFIADHNIDSVDLLIPDLNGILRGKRIRHDGLAKVYAEGIYLPGSVFGASITGDTVEATGLGFAEGDADRLCLPVPDSLQVVPWREGHAQTLLSMYELDRTPFVVDPRHVLAQVQQRFAALGLTPVVALELEFYLIDQTHTDDGGPQPPCSPTTGERERSTQVYGITELEDYVAFLEAIAAAAAAQHIPAEGAVAEYAPGQYELNLHYRDDVLLACDDVILLKRLIRNVALQHDMEATFMAKPYPNQAGNGMHAHISLIDRDGNNIFASDDPLGTAALRHAIAGLATTMAESMAIFAPNVNSYRRFQVDSYVPLAPTWGFNNRTLALRIPSGPGSARRVEHRVAGADVNPYLLMAALLSGIHHGLTQQLIPPEATTGNAYEQYPPSLPRTWPDALARFADSTLMQEYLGERFCAIYLANKSAECETFQRQITPLEHTWYLRTV